MFDNVCFHVNPVLDVDFMFDVQVATHLKGLADKAKLNEKHVKIARIYKAKAASLASERTELQERAQCMTEEVERLKSDLKHTTSARARAEVERMKFEVACRQLKANLLRSELNSRLRRVS